VSIFGSGFGLYGYLPAIIDGCGERVVLPERYRRKLLSRRDVGRFADMVEWVRDEAEALDRGDALIVTQRPSDQVRWVDDCLRRESIARLLLEKPLAPDPEAARLLLDRLERHRKRLRVGYIFRYLPWGRSLLAQRARGDLSAPIDIRWLFRAHHYAVDLDNWKRRVSMGGGAQRFFGIQLIALLAELGYSDVLRSATAAAQPDEAERWTATFAGSGLPDANIVLDSNSAVAQFSVRSSTRVVEIADPFAELASMGEIDRRVELLTELCRDFLSQAVGHPEWYRRSIDLWSAAERITIHEDD
jgi:predicted dehydrogenase